MGRPASPPPRTVSSLAPPFDDHSVPEVMVTTAPSDHQYTQSHAVLLPRTRTGPVDSIGSHDHGSRGAGLLRAGRRADQASAGAQPAGVLAHARRAAPGP